MEAFTKQLLLNRFSPCYGTMFQHYASEKCNSKNGLPVEFLVAECQYNILLQRCYHVYSIQWNRDLVVLFE
ncbi:hypothetical protein HA402_003907 [Bradysia odoriphaga]|nr:hypothetical protein HA402_003907 [Bradysia odoriphaga]